MEATNQTEKAAQKTAQKQTSLIDLVSRDQTLNAEMIWSLKVLKCKHSYRSSESKSKLFCSIFLDSKIAQNFTCGKTKCSYILCHGIAPVIKETLLNELKEVPYDTTLGDESYKISKKGQMGLHVRFWDDAYYEVKTSYWNSGFLGKASADDVFSKFNDCLSSLNRSKILQVSSNGPNVNLAFLNLVHENRKDDLLDPLIDIGTCSLHTLHRFFQTGEKATDWNIKKLLSSLNKIFDESSRRPDYERLTAATHTEYPLKFCAHQWIENASVAKRAQIIWPKIIEVLRFWKVLPKSKQPGKGKIGQNTSFDCLAKAVDDPTIPLKLRFFEEIAMSLNDFLVTFQTDNPMVPFLTESLDHVLRTLCGRFLRKDVLEETSSVYKMLKVDFSDKTNQVSLDSVDLGFAIKHDVKVLKKSGKLNENQLRNL